MIEINISASTVSWYGAIVATISVIMVILNYLRDRSRVKVRVSLGFLDSDIYFNTNSYRIIMEAINIGRRPVTLTNAGFLLRNGNKLIIRQYWPDSLPKKIGEGESITLIYDANMLLNYIKTDDDDMKISYGFFQSNSGKIYKAKFPIR